MSDKRRFIRKGRVYRFSVTYAQAIIFGAGDGLQMWAWGVWASNFIAEGIEGTLKRARQRVNENLDKIEAAR